MPDENNEQIEAQAQHDLPDINTKPKRLLKNVDPALVARNTLDVLKALAWVIVDENKAPIDLKGYKVDPFDPKNQHTFAKALKLWQSNPTLIEGIAYVLDGDIRAFDIDPVDAILFNRKHLPGRDVSETMQIGREIRDEIYRLLKSVYIEYSASKQGAHIPFRGTNLKDHPGVKLLAKMEINIYFEKRIIVATGDMKTAAHELLEDETGFLKFLNKVVELFGEEPLQLAEGEFEEVTYTDQTAAITRAAQLCEDKASPFLTRLNMPAAPGLWSTVAFTIIGDCVRAGMHRDLVYQIGVGRPFVTKSPPSDSGEERSEKWWRMLFKLGEYENAIRLQAERKTAQIEYARTHSYNNPELVKVLRDRVEAGLPLNPVPDMSEMAAQAAASVKEAQDQQASKATGSAVDRLFAEAAASPDTTLADITPVMKFMVPQSLPNTYRFWQENLMMMPYPNPTTALVGTLGAIAHLTQRTFFVEGKIGLSLYIMLLAGTSDSKDSLSEIMTCTNNVLRFAKPDGVFLNHCKTYLGALSHGTALHPSLWQNPRATLVSREGAWLFGGREKRTDANLVAVKDELLKLRTLTSFGSELPQKVYTKGDPIPPIQTPSVSVITETQPHRFYDAIIVDDYETGDLGRWLILNAWRAQRGAFNTNMLHSYSLETQQAIVAVASRALHANHTFDQSPSIINITYADAEAYHHKVAYQAVVDKLDAGRDLIKQSILGRSSYNVQAIAGNLAAFENPFNPKITTAMFDLALEIVSTDRVDLIDKIKSGETGKGDKRCMEAVKNWIVNSFQNARHRSLTTKMVKEFVIPLWWFNNKAGQNSAFTNHPLGQTEGLRRTLVTLCHMGALRYILATDAKASYGCESECYQVVDLAVLKD